MRAVATLLILLLASAPEAQVHTSRPGARLLPLPREEGVFHFLIFGDRTGGPVEGIEVLRHAVRDANLLDPDLVMNVGDMVQGYTQRPQWLRQMGEFREVMEGLRMPWFPTPGNHDIYWGGSPAPPGQHEADYEEHFGPLWYWFAHRNAAFVVLYTDEGDPATGEKGFGQPRFHRISPEQLRWLEQTLQETRELDHVFLFMHHPRWITDFYPGSNWDDVHRLLVAAGNVSAVFAGHIHRIRHEGLRDGIQYVTLATTGGRLPMQVGMTGWLHHMNLVTVREDRISIATLPVGAVLDPRELTPAHLAEIDTVVRLQPEPLGEGLQLEGSGQGGGTIRYRFTNPATAPIDLHLTSQAPAGDWHLDPDHMHPRLEPGESVEISFYGLRQGDALAGSFSVPELTWQVEYLARTQRILLPERTARMPLQLTRVDPTQLEAAPDRALVLDGRTAALRVESRRLALPDGPCTLEAWVRPATHGGMGSILGKTESSEFGLSIYRGRPRLYLHLDGAYLQLTASREHTLALGVWQHVAAVFDGAEARLYVDGTLVARRDGSGSRTPNTLPLFVGAEPSAEGRPGFFYQGQLDEVRISKCARYGDQQFTPVRRHAADDATVLLLHMDHSIGPFVVDHGPLGCHAVAQGQVSYEQVEDAPAEAR